MAKRPEGAQLAQRPDTFRAYVGHALAALLAGQDIPLNPNVREGIVREAFAIAQAALDLEDQFRDALTR